MENKIEQENSNTNNEAPTKKEANNPLLKKIYVIVAIALYSIFFVGILAQIIVSVVGLSRENSTKSKYFECVKDTTWISQTFNDTSYFTESYFGNIYSQAYVLDARYVNNNNTKYLVFDLNMTFNTTYYDNYTAQNMSDHNNESFYIDKTNKYRLLVYLEQYLMNHLANNKLTGFPYQNCQISIDFNTDKIESRAERENSMTDEIKDRVYLQAKQIILKNVEYPALTRFSTLEEMSTSEYASNCIISLSENVYMLTGSFSTLDSDKKYQIYNYSCMLYSANLYEYAKGLYNAY